MLGREGQRFFKAPDAERVNPDELAQGDHDAIKRLTSRGGANTREVDTAEHALALTLAREKATGADVGQEVVDEEREMPAELDWVPGEDISAATLEDMRLYLVQERDDDFSASELGPYGDLQQIEDLDEINAEVAQAWNTYRTYKENLGRSRLDAQARGQLRGLAARAHAAISKRELIMASMPDISVTKKKKGLIAGLKNWLNS
jgi:hypothetical protein